MPGLAITLSTRQLIVISDGTDTITLEFFNKRRDGNPALRILANPEKYKINRIKKDNQGDEPCMEKINI